MPPNRKNEFHHPYDKAYKMLLSNRAMFATLLHYFVPGDWAKKLDTEDLIRVDKSYVLSDYKEKEADLVYRAQLNGQEFYFYVLLEFQSRVDFQMPHRLLTYMTATQHGRLFVPFGKCWKANKTLAQNCSTSVMCSWM